VTFAIPAIASFLGGSAFRTVWGEVSHWLTTRQEHQQELERMRLQGELDAAAHAQQLEGIQLQAQMGVKLLEAKAEEAHNQATTQDLDGWLTAVRDVGKQTGIKWVDAWNASVRPLLATLAVAWVAGEIARNGFDLSPWDRDLIGAILGVYTADRSLAHRGK
jgi:hypothetical protein